MNTQSAPKHHHAGEEAVVGAAVGGGGAYAANKANKGAYPVMSSLSWRIHRCHR